MSNIKNKELAYFDGHKNCKDCKHLIDQEWEGTEWKQCEKQTLDWRYDDCPLKKDNIKTFNKQQ